MKLRGSALAVRLRASSFRWHQLVVLVAGFLIGCAYGTLPPRIVGGREFSLEAARAVQEGDSATTVRAALGEPFTIKHHDDVEVWRYYARERKDGVTYILGFIPNRTPHFIWDYELHLVICRGEVQEAKYEAIKIK
jgi:outer membrane protein assembly factor BamE (lipoprotein component of BamABCDE complex)